MPLQKPGTTGTTQAVAECDKGSAPLSHLKYCKYCLYVLMHTVCNNTRTVQ